MSILKAVLSGLNEDDREALIYSFNELICMIVDLEDDLFIGVHIQDTSDLEIIETNGMWFYGRKRIKEPKDA